MREDVVNMLRSIEVRPGLRKYSDRQIAGMLGLSQPTIAAIPKEEETRSTSANAEVDPGQNGQKSGGTVSPPAKTQGRDKRSYPTSQPSQAEVQRRCKLVKKLWGQGRLCSYFPPRVAVS